MSASTPTRRVGPATVFAWVFGIAFVVAGVWGFVETGFGDWTATEVDTAVLWFEVNPLHNLVHLLVGGGLVAGAATGETPSRIVTLLVAVVYAVVGFGGFWAEGQEWNHLAVNTADNWLHLGTAALGFAAVIASDRARPAGTLRHTR